MKGRQRGRNGGKPRPHQQGGHRNHNFDPNMGRMRGNAQQLMDKFLALARDASSQGDRVMAENYYQHADHYYRVLNARFEGQQNNQRRFNGQQPYDRPDRPFEGNEPQPGGFGDFNRVETPATMAAAQPMIAVAQQTQPLDQPPAQQQPQPAPQMTTEPDAEIGLPPQLFSANESGPQQGEPGDETDDSGEGDSQGQRQGRPRHGGRRRRAPRGNFQNNSAEQG